MSVVAQEPLNPATLALDAGIVGVTGLNERSEVPRLMPPENPNAASTGLDGGALLGVMVVGMLLVLAAVGAMTKHQTYWVMGGAFLILVALLAAGVAWMLRVLSEEETGTTAASTVSAPSNRHFASTATSATPPFAV